MLTHHQHHGHNHDIDHLMMDITCMHDGHMGNGHHLHDSHHLHEDQHLHAGHHLITVITCMTAV